MPVIIKIRHELCLSFNSRCASSFFASCSSLAIHLDLGECLAAACLAKAATCASDFVQSHMQCLSLGVALAAFRELFKAPCATRAPRRAVSAIDLRQLGISGMLLQPSFQRLRGIEMRGERFLLSASRRVAASF
jgi:hypothetical protein